MSAMKSTSALSKIFLRTFLENYKQNALPTCYRCLSSAAPNSKQSWTDKYKTKKKKIREKSEHVTVNQHAVFANNETSLKHIKVYGFDYDYTLASYKQELHSLIFRLGKDALVHKYKYPKDILKFEYSAEFAVRGLHYDIRKGLLMKLDSFHNIQLGTVYRGMQKVSDEEVIKLYDGTHVALESMNTFYGLNRPRELSCKSYTLKIGSVVGVMDGNGPRELSCKSYTLKIGSVVGVMDGNRPRELSCKSYTLKIGSVVGVMDGKSTSLSPRSNRSLAACHLEVTEVCQPVTVTEVWQPVTLISLPACHLEVTEVWQPVTLKLQKSASLSPRSNRSLAACHLEVTEVCQPVT
ncbi:5'-nucleotidase domain-containing protein 3,5'-nucleotidase domain-containing protein 2 [Mytilus edulis]|uniref:5'-nucleotidase domain-containing protein 3,5'-nucleotidase domain-containing protein 2 n=1 Tax=Mytilus edulis TaxID=6550 RepID=A0A8S3UG82_MYTED|nr:5'-nucleotidase domain-containing protein 3,5'-nucleotidase domain-containing protein 2 [Mytilus edulis]